MLETRPSQDPAVPSAVRRTLKDPRADALAENFAGQWLNLRGLEARPLPDYLSGLDDSARQAMRASRVLSTPSPRRPQPSTAERNTVVNERLGQSTAALRMYTAQLRGVTIGAAWRPLG